LSRTGIVRTTPENATLRHRPTQTGGTNGWHTLAKKGISQTDLEQGIIGSAPAAERIADVMRLFPMVLLREDPRLAFEGFDEGVPRPDHAGLTYFIGVLKDRR
jgi:hypothetical protein